jgi:hypothetical protein
VQALDDARQLPLGDVSGRLLELDQRVDHRAGQEEREGEGQHHHDHEQQQVVQQLPLGGDDDRPVGPDRLVAELPRHHAEGLHPLAAGLEPLLREHLQPRGLTANQQQRLQVAGLLHPRRVHRARVQLLLGGRGGRLEAGQLALAQARGGGQPLILLVVEAPGDGDRGAEPALEAGRLRGLRQRHEGVQVAGELAMADGGGDTVGHLEDVADGAAIEGEGVGRGERAPVDVPPRGGQPFHPGHGRRQRQLAGCLAADQIAAHRDERLQRSGQSAATMSAVRAPQSKPATIALSIPSASIKAIVSTARADCRPLRSVSSERKRVVR